MNDSDYLDKDHQFLGKNRSGYIFPINVRTKMVVNEEGDDEMYFITYYKTEPVTKQYVFFILDKKGVGFGQPSSSLTCHQQG
jgi:hypothetical protein